MSSKDRIAALAKTYLDTEREPDFDLDFGEANISSVVAMSFVKSISSEFNLEIPGEDFATLNNLKDIVAYVDARVG